jgi:hypothetical protein
MIVIGIWKRAQIECGVRVLNAAESMEWNGIGMGQNWVTVTTT